MQITVNGEATAVEAPCTVAALLARTGVGATLVAVELNREVVPRDEHATRELSEGDAVEILRLVGGG